MGRVGERGSFGSIPPPPNLCPPATGTGDAEEGARAEGESVWGGGRSAEAVSPGFLPAGGVTCAHLPARGSGWPGGLPREQDQASAFASRMHLTAFWSLCWHLVPPTPGSEESRG